ncbi:MAG: septum formation initiator family protein [Bacteroidales bacterium]|nr:septum formation initiator family protein [Bacteroidales bacterium]
MGRFKEKIDTLRGKNLFFRILINKYVIATLVFLVIVCFTDRNNVRVLHESLSTIRSQKRQELYYKKEIKALDEKIEQMGSNKDTLEMFARENYYFKEDGEDVFLIKKK